MKPGDRLPNGALVLEIRPTEYSDESVVLALWPTNRPPYVTWRVDPEDPGSTRLGDYCETLAEGLESLDARSGRPAVLLHCVDCGSPVDGYRCATVRRGSESEGTVYALCAKHAGGGS